jgi:hypothetical protein
MNGEFECIWKEAVVVYSMYYLGVCLEGLRKAMESFSLDTLCPG